MDKFPMNILCSCSMFRPHAIMFVPFPLPTPQERRAEQLGAAWHASSWVGCTRKYSGHEIVATWAKLFKKEFPVRPGYQTDPPQDICSCRAIVSPQPLALKPPDWKINWRKEGKMLTSWLIRNKIHMKAYVKQFTTFLLLLRFKASLLFMLLC